ncbi:MAG: hypothetical protein M1834_006052 [Cirrosporium novae-zelandiae]|nr:MAG: hypothetical protein M1834_006052 [Cirrosporium novae-zelandiae]
MKLSQHSSSSILLSTLLLIPSVTLVSGYNLDCKKVLVDKTNWDFSKLGGPHSVLYSQPHWPTTKNTTFTLDICNPLQRSKNKEERKKECASGTHVCAIERTIYEDGTEKIDGIINIAGNYGLTHGHPTLEPYWTRLKSSNSHADTDKEGVRLELHGGQYPFDEPTAVEQKAVIEFLCDESRTGLEDEDKKEKRRDDKEEDGDDEDGEGEGDDDDEDSGPKNPPTYDDGRNPDRSLRFISYQPEDKADVLRLEWRTKYACESALDNDPSSGNNDESHWGVFTWFIIVVFLTTASYLIFSSWINYNRYGARGWDLVPHSDTVRDLPYLLRDWGRRVVGTVSGDSARNRGGYSAV